MILYRGDSALPYLRSRPPSNSCPGSARPDRLSCAAWMKRSARKNAFYAQSGGVSAVINASACGLIETARKHRDRIGKVYAGRHGIIGALTEDLIDTSKESRAAIGALRHTPGGAFGSARYKLAGIDKNRAQYERLIDGISRPRHRLFLLQRRQRLHGYRPQGVRNRHAVGIPDHLHRHTQDRRQRSADDRLLPGLRFGGQVHCRLDARGRARRAVDGAHLDQSVRARGHGPSRRLDCRCGRPGRREERRRPAHHLVPRNNLRPHRCS